MVAVVVDVVVVVVVAGALDDVVGDKGDDAD